MKPCGLSVVVILTNLFFLVSCQKPATKSKGDVKSKGDFDEENYGVKYASKCEVCKVVTGEVEYQLNSIFKSPEVIQTGYNYMQDNSKAKKKTKYEKSMIRLQEALESTCGAIMEYNIHKERTDWTRFARGQSQTFKTLHGLKNKGVKVDLGIPDEMWDKPSAEITQLKSQCETFLENNEEDIEEWYQKGSEVPLEDVICKKKLKKKEQDCLNIKALPAPEESKGKKSKKDKETFKNEKELSRDKSSSETEKASSPAEKSENLSKPVDETGSSTKVTPSEENPTATEQKPANDKTEL